MHQPAATKHPNRMRSVTINFLGALALLFVSAVSVAQQSNTYAPASFSPLVAETEITATEAATLSLVGIQNVSYSNAPYRFEWRAESETGTLLGSGTLTETAMDKTRFQDPVFSVRVDKPATIFLIVYDASAPAQRSVVSYQVEQQ